MRLITLNCNECGAPLEVPIKTRYVTCAFCSSRLAIHQSGNAFYSEILERLEQQTARIADQVESLRIETDLARVAREWERDREKYQVRSKDGQLYVPTRAGSILGGVFIVVFGAIWTAGAANMGAPFFFPLFGIAFIALGIFQAMRSVSLADDYARRQRKYQRDRRSVASRLNQSDESR